MDVIRLWSYLDGVDYPAAKADVVAASERAGAPQGMLEFLQSLEGERYDSPEALQVAIQGRLSEPRVASATDGRGT
jgi:hypothetical protein